MYKGYFDGAAGPTNPGWGGAGWVFLKDGEMYDKGFMFCGQATNNEAEYVALLRLAENAVRFGMHGVEVFGDSELVVNQVNRVWQCKEERLAKYRDAVLYWLNQLEGWSLSWVPRAQNQVGDDLSKRALEVAGVPTRR